MAEKMKSEISVKSDVLVSIAIGISVTVVLAISAAYQFDMPASAITSEYLFEQAAILFVAGLCIWAACFMMLCMTECGLSRESVALFAPLVIMFIVFAISFGSNAMAYPQYFYHYAPLFFLGHNSYHGQLATGSILPDGSAALAMIAAVVASAWFLKRRTLNVPIIVDTNNQSTQV